jgi:hypothetical protein
VWVLLSAKQDLLRTINPIRDIEERFTNLGKDVGSDELSGKLGPEPLPSLSRITAAITRRPIWKISGGCVRFYPTDKRPLMT